jgi:hypothetical protein
MPKGKRSRPGWRKIQDGNYGGCGAVWEHHTGWKVIHCGHPTANYPYYGESPDGKEIMLAGGIGKGMAFCYLTDAQIACELYEHNRAMESLGKAVR